MSNEYSDRHIDIGPYWGPIIEPLDNDLKISVRDRKGRLRHTNLRKGDRIFEINFTPGHASPPRDLATARANVEEGTLLLPGLLGELRERKDIKWIVAGDTNINMQEVAKRFGLKKVAHPTSLGALRITMVGSRKTFERHAIRFLQKHPAFTNPNF